MGKLLGDDETTIFSSRDTMDTAEREAVKSGEKRGEKMAMLDDPDRFAAAGSKAKGKKNWDKNYEMAFGHG